MARIETITNKPDLLAFIYDKDTLPTAVVAFDRFIPSTVHALREGNVELFDKLVEFSDYIEDINEPFEIKAYRFVEDYHDQSHNDTGLHLLAEAKGEQVKEGTRGQIRDAEVYARKTFEQCA